MAPKSPEDNNVIYANFGTRKRVSTCLLYTSDAADDIALV